MAVQRTVGSVSVVDHLTPAVGAVGLLVVIVSFVQRCNPAIASSLVSGISVDAVLADAVYPSVHVPAEISLVAVFHDSQICIMCKVFDILFREDCVEFSRHQHDVLSDGRVE